MKRGNKYTWPHNCSNCKKIIKESEAIFKGVTTPMGKKIKWYNCPHDGCEGSFIKHVKENGGVENETK